MLCQKLSKTQGDSVSSALNISKIFFPVKEVIMATIAIISLSEFLETIRSLGVSHFRAFLIFKSYKLDSSMYKLSKFTLSDE